MRVDAVTAEMSSNETIVAPVREVDARYLATLSAAGPRTVWFLSDSRTAYLDMERRLPAGWSVAPVGERLNAAAERLRDSVINIDAAAWPAFRDGFAWDASLVGEHGPLTSTLMLSLSRLCVFADVLRMPGRHLVIGQDPALCRLFLHEAERKGAKAGWKNADGTVGVRQRWDIALDWTTGVIAALRRRASILARFIVRKVMVVRARKSAAKGTSPADRLRDADVVVVLWGRARTFPPSGVLTEEVNFGALPSALRQAGLRVAYLVNPLTAIFPFRDIVANALQAHDPVVLTSELTPWWSIFAALMQGLFLPWRIRSTDVCGVDATAALRHDARRDLRLGVSVEARLFHNVGCALGRARVRAVLHLYEGQPWEKMLTRGVRSGRGNARVVAMQHAPIAWNYVSAFPSRRTIASPAFADRLLTCGPGYAEWFAAAGVPSDKLGVAGALRYPVPAAPPPPGDCVLCCPGIEYDEAAETATKAALATRGLGRKLIVNFHPVTDDAFRARLSRELHDALGGDMSHVTLSTETIKELIAQVRVVVYTSSASCFEAVQSGRVAIYAARDFAIDLDKLPDEIALRARSVSELRSMIEAAYAGETPEQSPDALRRWIAPPASPDALRSLLLVEKDAA